MMGQCAAIKRNGEPCTLPANGPHGLCWAHDPKNAEKRRRGASRGGKARANREIPAITARLEDLEERELATDTFSLWEGFAAFCEESVGVPAESVVAVVLEAVASPIEGLKDRAERLELEAKAETAEEMREGLAESWRVIEERGV